MREHLAEFDIEQREGVHVARVVGEIDASNADDLRLALTERLPNATIALVLDLSQVGYIDSSGVQLLFDLGRRLTARRQKMRLVVPEGARTRRVLELCNVGSLTPVDHELESSMAALAGGG